MISSDNNIYFMTKSANPICIFIQMQLGEMKYATYDLFLQNYIIILSKNETMHLSALSKWTI